MPAGRPPRKEKIVDELPAGELERQRLQVILKTISGELSVPEACNQLNLSESRFHDLRRKALEGALGALALRQAGRPRKVDEPEPGQVKELEEQVRELEFELQAARVKTEIAVTMPHLLREKPGKAGKAKKAKKRGPQRRKPKPRVR